jgi:hypothetical protein
VKERYKYMGTKGPNVLDVIEPPEPDNIIWRNMEVNPVRRRLLTFFFHILSSGILIMAYYLILEAKKVSVSMLALSIGCVDSILPVIFTMLTDLSAPASEGARQNSLQLMLFVTRLMLATIFPYMQTNWQDTLGTEFISQIIEVQLAVSFISPIINLLDIAGLVSRNLYAPKMAKTQQDLNSKWIGSEWSIADRYTNAVKIQFVSLYYALITVSSAPAFSSSF